MRAALVSSKGMMTIMALENRQKDTGAADSTPPMSHASTRTFTREQIRLRERYGPWAVVTGASDGIGREFAARLAEAGVNLVLAARRQELLDDVAKGLARAHEVQVERCPSILRPRVFSSHQQALGRRVRSWKPRSMKNWG